MTPADSSADPSAHRIADRFVSARRTARGLTEYPGNPPKTLAEAYAIQDAAMALVDERIHGWKVGRIFPPLSEQFGADRLAGPIFESLIVPASAESIGRIFVDGFGAAEAEFLLRIGTAPSPGQVSFSLEEAAGHVDAVHIGLEIASSPFQGINSLGPAVTISDFGNNNGLLVGPAIPDFNIAALEASTVCLSVDGVTAGAGAASAFPQGLLGSVRFLMENLGARGIALTPGCWISSGAITGVHPVRAGQHVMANFGAFGSLECTIGAQQPVT